MMNQNMLKPSGIYTHEEAFDVFYPQIHVKDDKEIWPWRLSEDQYGYNGILWSGRVSNLRQYVRVFHNDGEFIVVYDFNFAVSYQETHRVVKMIEAFEPLEEVMRNVEFYAL